MAATTDLSTGSRASTFARVLVGVDGSEACFEACRQAAVLALPDAPIEAVAVVHLADAVQVGLEAGRAADALREEAAAALVRAGAILGGRAETRFVNGFVAAALRREIAAFEASVIAVGSHGHRRLTEILIGGVAGELLHSAPCSVLVARPPAEEGAFPARVVVGVDGSRPSRAALAEAGELAGRFGVPLDVVVALDSRDVDLDAVRRHAPAARQVDAQPVAALVEAAPPGSLLAVGCRGLHGMRALGSVSERVAHQARCSVLVVREPGAC